MSNLTEAVSLDCRDGVAHIRLNRPDVLNALNQAMAEKLLGLFQDVSASTQIRVVVLSGIGRAFMAGTDLQTYHADISKAAQTAEAVIRPFHQALAALVDLPQPVVTMLHGYVSGGGIGLMLLSDYVIADDSTSFNLGYSATGSSVGGAITWTLPRIVGLNKALELSLLSDPIGAEEALNLGLINRVVSLEKLSEEANALSRRLANGPTLAYTHIRRLMRTSYGRSFADQLEAERNAFVVCARSKDFAEGVEAFFGGREPHFYGK